MRKKYILFSAATAAILFGLTIAGCNRNSDRTAMRSNKNRQNPAVRPAEVLSASTYRPPARQTVSVQQYDGYAALPPAQPVVHYQPAAMPTPTMAIAQSATYSTTHGYQQPPARPIIVQPLPAVAAQPVQPVQEVYAAPQPSMMAMAPIPELEPARTYRMPTQRTPNTRPVAEIMISERTVPAANRQEIIRALAPIETVPVAVQPVVYQENAWVASPITAMNSSRAWR